MTESNSNSNPKLNEADSHYRIHRFGTLETVVMRLAFAAVVYATLLSSNDVSVLTQQPNATGIAHFVDLTWLSDVNLFEWVQRITMAALVLYGLGLLLPVALPLLFLGYTLPWTLYYSQGAVHHDKHIVSLILLIQCLVYLLGSLARMRKRPLPFGEKIRLSDASLAYSQQVLIAMYVISGVQKILRTKGLWPWQSSNLAVEIVKTNGQRFHNYLEKAADHERNLALAQWMADNPMLVRLGASGALLLEIFAFLALANRKAAAVFGVLLIAMHQSIGATMGLPFTYNQWCCLIFLINLPFWLGLCWARTGKRSQGMTGQIEPDFPWGIRGWKKGS